MFAGAQNLEAERASWDERWRLLLGARLPAGTTSRELEFISIG